MPELGVRNKVITMCDPVTHLNLGFVATGLFSLMVALQYQSPNEKFRYSISWCFAQSLTILGRVIFFIGLMLVFIGVYI